METRSRLRTARPEQWGNTADASPVTFDQFIASVYDPANRDVFRRRGARVSDDDLRAEFVLALYRLRFPTDLTPTRANHLLRHLARQFVNRRLGDAARRRTTREAPAARHGIASVYAATHTAASPDAAAESKLARLMQKLAQHPAILSQCLTLAVRNPGHPSLADAQQEVSPYQFRAAMRTVRTVAEATGVL